MVRGLQLTSGPGRTGKLEVVKTIKAKFICKYNSDELYYYVIATTRKATTMIDRSTAYSHKKGLGILVNNYVKLSKNTLKSIRDRLKNTKIIIIDKFFIMKQRELFFLSKRLKEIKTIIKYLEVFALFSYSV